jgi:adenine phosphoribosyltransferase
MTVNRAWENTGSGTLGACHLDERDIGAGVATIARMVDLYEYIVDVPDFPEPGIIFKDITPLLASPAAFLQAVNEMAEPFLGSGVDIVVGIESRGFLLAGSIAERIGSGVGLVRKPGKLPRKTVSVTYDLEYGTDTLEIHADAFPNGARVLIVDDVLATGGTLAASRDLIVKAGGDVVGATMLLELSFLDGRSRFDDPLHAVLVY